jgi:hypothetical protein
LLDFISGVVMASNPRWNSKRVNSQTITNLPGDGYFKSKDGIKVIPLVENSYFAEHTIQT